jgi:hypothetical protein
MTALFAAVHESAFDTKRTFGAGSSMSVFGGKADITAAQRNVCFSPYADPGRHEPLVPLAFTVIIPRVAAGASARFVMLQPISVEGDELAPPFRFHSGSPALRRPSA